MALRFLLPPSLGAAKAAARAEVIQAALRRDLGEDAQAIVTPTYGELEERASRADAEIVWCPSAVCAKLEPDRVHAVLAIMREGRTSYRSAIVARKADQITTATLAHRRAVWVDPLSAGGYLLAIALLEARKVDVNACLSSQRFVGSHRAVVEALLHGEADVGAVFVPDLDETHVASTLRWYAGLGGDRLEAIAISESCPSDAVVVTTAVEPKRAAAIAARLAARAPHVPRILAALEAQLLVPTELSRYRRAFSG